MADSKDNVLGIQATIDSSEIEKGVNDFIRKITEMEKATDKATNAMSNAFRVLEDKVKSLSSALASNQVELDKILSSFQSYTPTDTVSLEKFNELKGQYAEALKIQSELKREISDVTKELNDQKAAHDALYDSSKKSMSPQTGTSATVSNDASVIAQKRKLKEELKELDKALRANEKQYEANSQQLDAYDAKLQQLYAAQEKGIKVSLRGSASMPIEESIRQTEEGYEKLRAQQIALNAEIDEQKLKHSDLTKSYEEMAQKPETIQSRLRAITEELRIMSANGEDGTERFRELAEEAANLKDEIKDVNAEMRASQEGGGFAAAAEGINVLSGALTVGMGVASLFGMEEEKLVKIQTKLQSVMAITMGLQQATQVLMSGSILKSKLLGAAQTYLSATTLALGKAFIRLGLSATAAKIAVGALYAVATAGLSLVITGLISVFSALGAKQEKVNKITKEGIKQRREEEKELAALIDVLKNEKLTKEQIAIAQKKLNEKVEDYLGIIKDEKSSIDEQIEAYNNLKRLVPDLTEKYSMLALQGMNAAYSLKLVAEGMEQSKNEKDVKNVEQLKARIDELSKSPFSTWWNQSEIDKLEQKLAIAQRTIQDSMNPAYTPVINTIKGIEAEIKDLEREKQTIKEFYTEDTAYAANLIIDIDNQIAERENRIKELRGVMYSEEYEKAKEAWEAADKALYDARQNREKYGTKEYFELVALANQTETAFKNVGGDTSQTYEKKMQDEARRAEELVAMRNKTNQDLASLDNNALKRELSRIRNSYDQRIAEIEKQERKWKEAQKGVLTEEQETEISRAKDAAKSERDTDIDRAHTAYKKKQLKYQELVVQSGKYNARIAKDAEFAVEQSRIDALKEGGEKTLAQMALNHAREREELEREKADYLQAKRNAAKELFEANEDNEGKLFDASTVMLTEKEEQQFSQKSSNLAEKQSRESAETNREVLNTMLGDFMTYTQAREQIEREFAEKKLELDKAVAQGTASEANIVIYEKEKSDALAAIDEEFAAKSEEFVAWTDTIAEMSVKQLLKALEIAKQELESAEGAEKPNEQELTEARAKIKLLEDQIKKLDAKASTDTRTIDKWKDLKDVLDDVAGEFEAVGEAIGGTVGKAISTIGSLSADTIGLINNIFEFSDMCQKGILKTSEGAVSGIKAVESTSVILAIISAAIQIITKVVNLAKEAHNATYEENIEAHQKKIDDLEKSYEKLSDTLDETFGSTKVQNLKEMNENLQRQNDLIEKQKQEEAEIKQKNEDYDKAIEGYNDVQEENRKKMAENSKAMEEAIFGSDIQSAIENFADAYADAVNANMSMNESAKEQAKKAMKEMVMASIKEYIDGSGKIQAIRDKMEALYADGVFSTSDQKIITDLYKELNNEIDKKFEWAEDILSDSDGSSSSSSKRGIATASQESVDENNGRLMSLQMSAETLRSLSEQQVALQQLISYDISTIRKDMEIQNKYISEIVDIQYESVGYLSGIKKDTARLEEIEKSLSRISINTQYLRK